nr:hypothetical protein OH837_49020 [Streptomyces canus]
MAIPHHTTTGDPMQTTVQTIPAGTLVKTAGGRNAVTVDNSMVVKNSETGTVTITNLIRFPADDVLSPNGEWIWLTDQLTVVHTLRLIDPDGYTVPGGVRTATPETDTAVRADLKQLAVEHAAQWADFGYRATAYRIT